MNIFIKFLFCLTLVIETSSVFAAKRLCELLSVYECPSGSGRSYSRSVGASMPTSSSAFSINPSSMSLDKGWGFEILKFENYYDISFVTGTGRIGAGLSTSQPENTFFGNMASEETSDYQTRIVSGEKFESSKLNLATAVNLYGKAQNSLLAVNLGVMGIYNKDLKKITPGGGISVELGPLSFGMALVNDYWLDPNATNRYLKQRTITYSLGLKLPFFAIDYALFKNDLDFDPDNNIKIFITSFFFKKWMAIYGSRTETSFRSTYDYETKTFSSLNMEKTNVFLGAQYSVHKYLLLGIFHNYYLLNGYSVGLTLFV